MNTKNLNNEILKNDQIAMVKILQLPLIPKRMAPDGPASQAIWRRTLVIFLVMCITGGVLQIMDLPSTWHAFGMGLILPGAGFLYAAHPLLAVINFLLFPLSLFVLWMLGPVLLPPLIWIGGAALSTQFVNQEVWDSTQYIIPFLLSAFVFLVWLGSKIQFTNEVKEGERLNSEIANVKVQIPIFNPECPPIEESTVEELESLRYCLDLALQPLNNWDGFVMKDQFREAALRYQLQFIQYACATSQYTRTPAFGGYLALAQRNVIEKMLDPIVWKYWRWENLWGNLEWNPDPIIRDNVMLSGYWAVMVGLYQAMNNDNRYSQKGSLTFRNGPDENYAYDFGRLAEVMHTNLNRTPLGQFPCEPSWIYPFCNSYAMNTLVLHDRLEGTSYCERNLPRFREKFEQEFMSAHGKTVFIKNGRWGFNLPTSPLSDGTLVFWFNPFMPEVTRRLWWTMRNTTLKMESGELNLNLDKAVQIDAGNYKFNNGIFGRGLLQYAAREMGDEEVYQALQKQIDRLTSQKVDDGKRWYPEMSVYGNAQHTLARFGRENALHDMVNSGLPDSWRNGPLINKAAYPDVLIAKAVSDGAALEMVLRPGAKVTRTKIGLSRLKPHMQYRIEGALDSSLAANHLGEADFEVNLTGRLEVRVIPII